MTYKLSINQIKDIRESLQYNHTRNGKGICVCDVCEEMDSLYQSMDLTNQKFVYVKGQPNY